jgi:hypothetical protein
MSMHNKLLVVEMTLVCKTTIAGALTATKSWQETALAPLSRFGVIVRPLLRWTSGCLRRDGISEGLATLEEIVAASPIHQGDSGNRSERSRNAVRAVDPALYDFYYKPIDPEILGMIVNRAYRVRELELENRELMQQKVDHPAEG